MATSASAQHFPAEIVHRIELKPDGGIPYSLMQASDGNFYGVSVATGTEPGAMFRLQADGLFTVLHRFSGRPGGESPSSRLIQASDGQLYGVTVSGGRYGWGTIFRMTLNGQLTVLYSFAGQPDEPGPRAVIQRATAPSTA